MSFTDERHLLDRALRRSSEDKVKSALGESNIPYVFSQPLEDSKYRPDFLVPRSNDLFLIEVDEHQHKSYDQSVEGKRTLDLQAWANNFCHKFADAKLPPVKVVIIRFNPNSYSVNGVKAPMVPFELKVKRLIHLLRCYQPSQAFEMLFLYFDVDEHGELQVPWLYLPSCSGLKPFAKSIGSSCDCETPTTDLTTANTDISVEENQSRKRRSDESEDKRRKKHSTYFSIFWRKSRSGRNRGITVRTTNPLGKQQTVLISIEKLQSCAGVSDGKKLIMKATEELGFDEERAVELVNNIDWSPLSNVW